MASVSKDDLCRVHRGNGPSFRLVFCNPDGLCILADILLFYRVAVPGLLPAPGSCAKPLTMEMCIVKIYPNGGIFVCMPDGKEIPCQAGVEVKQGPKDAPTADVTLRLIAKVAFEPYIKLTDITSKFEK